MTFSWYVEINLKWMNQTIWESDHSEKDLVNGCLRPYRNTNVVIKDLSEGNTETHLQLVWVNKLSHPKYISLAYFELIIQRNCRPLRHKDGCEKLSF
jgi:hypothetical protein